MKAEEEGEIAVLVLSGVNYHFNGHTPGAFSQPCPFSPSKKKFTFNYLQICLKGKKAQKIVIEKQAS